MHIAFFARARHDSVIFSLLFPTVSAEDRYLQRFLTKCNLTKYCSIANRRPSRIAKKCIFCVFWLLLWNWYCKRKALSNSKKLFLSCVLVASMKLASAWIANQVYFALASEKITTVISKDDFFSLKVISYIDKEHRFVHALAMTLSLYKQFAAGLNHHKLKQKYQKLQYRIRSNLV